MKTPYSSESQSVATSSRPAPVYWRSTPNGYRPWGDQLETISHAGGFWFTNRPKER